jgi:acetylglutamate kinase
MKLVVKLGGAALDDNELVSKFAKRFRTCAAKATSWSSCTEAAPH